MSDVPVGSYLSGGMDSGSITSIAAAQPAAADHVHRGLRPQLGVRPGTSASTNAAAAEVMANLFKTEHYEVVMHAGDMEWVLPKLIWHLEDLRVGQCLSELLRRSAGRQVRQGRTLRRRRRRAVRRIPMAVLPGAQRIEPRRILPPLLRFLAAPGARRRKAETVQRRDAATRRRSSLVRRVPRCVRRIPGRLR